MDIGPIIRRYHSKSQFAGALDALLEIKFPYRKKLGLKAEDLASYMQDDTFFICGDVALPEGNVEIKRLTDRDCHLYQVRKTDRPIGLHAFKNGKASFGNRLQLLAHLVLAIREGMIPLPAPDDDGIMVFPYIKRATISAFNQGMSYQVWGVYLTPQSGRWRIDDTSDNLIFEEGDACCIFRS